VTAVVPEERLQQLIASKDIRRTQSFCNQYGYSEGWAIMDGCLIIYDMGDSPSWLIDQLMQRDDDGNTPAFYDSDKRQDLEEQEKSAA
jgi:hypothetical protein